MTTKHKERVFQGKVPKRAKAALGSIKNVHKRVKKGR